MAVSGSKFPRKQISPGGGNCLTFGCSGGEMISATAAAAAAAARGTRELCADKSLDGLAA